VTSSLSLRTAGELIRLQASGRFLPTILECGIPEESTEPASLTVVVGDDRRPFDVTGWAKVARGIWVRNGDAVVRNVCSSGFDMHVDRMGGEPRFTFRWRPPWRERAAAILLRSRARLLHRAVLVQYPSMWRALLRNRAPLHASACTAGALTVVVAGPGGAGKSTLIAGEVTSGGYAVSDNLVVTDGRTVWGVVEPMRTETGLGPRTSHGRREAQLPGRVADLRPDHLIVLRRGSEQARNGVRPCEPREAARALTASTYLAGELRRFWSFVAALAVATDMGPPHPAVADRARELAASTLCLEATLSTARLGIRELLGVEEVAAAC
jgi:hypothetical protein